MDRRSVATSPAVAAAGAMIGPGGSAAEARNPERPKTQRPKTFGAARPCFVETDDGASLFYNDWGAGRPVLFLGRALTSEVMESCRIQVYLGRMDAYHVPLGVLLRRWRDQRRMTQTDLAVAAESSTRHLSYLETGKAQPSREMVGRLAEYLDVPLRDRNTLLLAAGFAPAFTERSVDELEAAKSAIEGVLRAHGPLPAFAVDRHWNVVLSNAALPQLYEGCSEKLLRKPVNAVRLTLHPEGMGPRIVNFAAWRAYTVSVLRRQLEARWDPIIKGLLAEVALYPIPADAEKCEPFEGSERLATPMRISTRFGVASFLNTVTVFGTPNDVTLAELALEMLYPADQQTTAIVKRMVQETDLMAEQEPQSSLIQSKA
jgi:transcriptional regulator with XRE-family HTH domain